MSENQEQSKESVIHHEGNVTSQEKPVEAVSRKMCKICGEKQTISDSCPYCPSCMRKKSLEYRKNGKAPVRTHRGRPKKDKDPSEKTPHIENMAVIIAFDKYPLIYKRLQTLAEQEIRPIDLQVIYILKGYLDSLEFS